MSYSRFVIHDWYIFWDAGSSSINKEPSLSIWHKNHQGVLFSESYTNLKKLQGDYYSIPGYKESETEHCKECIEEFIEDVEWRFEQDPNAPILDGWKPNE